MTVTKETIIKKIKLQTELLTDVDYTQKEINCWVNGFLRGFVMAEIITGEEAMEILEECLK